jgi:hypothetical protein
MPLFDHFHPPLSRQRQWESFHGAWAEAIAKQLNEDLLPPRYFAEARAKVGRRVEVDVSTLEDRNGTYESETSSAGSVALWAPPRPAATTPLAFSHPDLFEIQVWNDEEGPRLVAAIELVSPANKDRAAHRHIFAVKCGSYLQSDVSLMIVDVVTERTGNLHRALLDLLGVSVTTPGQGDADLYASAYRTVPVGETLSLEAWAETLTVGNALPTLPLWIGPELSLPVNLEETYQTACAARRIS